jgi:hypothetical protein
MARGDAAFVELPVLRSVVMGPSALGATTRSAGAVSRGLFDVYAEHLIDLTERIFLRQRADAFVNSFQPRESLLVLHQRANTLDVVEGALGHVTDGRIRNFVRSSESVEEARIAVSDFAQPLRFVFVGADGGGREDEGGYSVYEAICARNDAVEDPAVQVEAVVFLTVANRRHEERLQAIERRYTRLPATRYIADRVGNDDRNAPFVTGLSEWLVSRT